jgi:N-carbamoylputrescine amidase
MRMTVAATQFACTWDLAANLDTAEALVREAAGNGAQVVLLQELFETPYFCPDERAKHFALARPREAHPVLARFSALARELGVVLPFSFFEKVGSTHFNSLVMLDADGRDLGLYRKSHIPQGPGYREKFFFAPGDTGFQVWDTAFGRIGAAICWDQWFPECARSLALKGAELIFYPTAIGTEPLDPGLDSQPLAADDAGSRRRQHGAGDRVQSHRP